MREAARLLNESRAKLAELEQHLVACEGYVRRMLVIATSRRPMKETEDRIARQAFVALSELTEVRDRWKTALDALEGLNAAANGKQGGNT